MNTPKPPSSDIVRFGSYEADLSAGELLCKGRRLRLQEQPFQVLALLLERAGEVVTRDEFRERLWPGDTFVDFDHSLNTAINKLREALDDSAASPRFIETMARRGYRFIAPVTTSGSISVSGLGGSQALPQAPRAIVRLLFLMIQVMYLVLYFISLTHYSGVQASVEAAFPKAAQAMDGAILITALVGIPTRLFFFCAVALDFQGAGRHFSKIFAALFVLDVFWAFSPLLLQQRLGPPLALAATAALLLVPFAQRTLMGMAYGKK